MAQKKANWYKKKNNFKSLPCGFGFRTYKGGEGVGGFDATPHKVFSKFWNDDYSKGLKFSGAVP